MAEASVTRDRDVRAGRFVAALRATKGLSPEQMAPQCGVGASTIRDIEMGVIPNDGTQVRLAMFFNIDRGTIWKRPRKPKARKRSLPQKAVAAVEAATGDLSAMEAVQGADATDSFALGVAWAVIRAQSPFSSSQDVTDRALQAVEAWHGASRPARASA